MNTVNELLTYVMGNNLFLKNHLGTTTELESKVLDLLFASVGDPVRIADLRYRLEQLFYSKEQLIEIQMELREGIILAERHLKIIYQMADGHVPWNVKAILGVIPLDILEWDAQNNRLGAYCDATLDSLLHAIQKRGDHNVECEVVKQALLTIRGHQYAVDTIVNTIKRNCLDCDLVRITDPELNTHLAIEFDVQLRSQVLHG